MFLPALSLPADAILCDPPAVLLGNELSGLEAARVLRSHSYTPGLLLAASPPRRGISPRSDDAVSSGRFGDSLFMQTLTHGSSWVMKELRQRPRGSARDLHGSGGFPPGLDALAEESGDLEDLLQDRGQPSPSGSA